MNQIVVGVDGSDASVHALRWAVEEARVRNARLLAVRAWAFPTFGDFTEMVTEELDRALKSVDHDDVAVERLVVQGAPARTLLDAAEGADLLVVGARGLGGFRSLLLGSVSQECVHHAPCPVVVVR